MNTITINTRKSAALDEWMSKEYGSWEDDNYSDSHVYAILKRFGGKVTLTENEARTLILSGEYQSTGWMEDEIEGGERTMQIIANYVKKVKLALAETIN